ncbi:MAG: hypothetical protein ACNA8R_13960, partial [Nitriliruptoraceae bacterium]
MAVAVLSGCSSPDDGDGIEAIDAPEAPVDEDDDAEVVDEPEAAEDPDPAPEPDPPAEIDITVIPDEITLEYVDAVLVELERLFAEAVRSVVENEEMTLEASDLLNSAFGGTELDSVFADLMVLAEDPSIARPPGEIAPNTYVAIAVLDEAAGCLWVETVANLSGSF